MISNHTGTHHSYLYSSLSTRNSVSASNYSATDCPYINHAWACSLALVYDVDLSYKLFVTFPVRKFFCNLYTVLVAQFWFCRFVLLREEWWPYLSCTTL